MKFCFDAGRQHHCLCFVKTEAATIQKHFLSFKLCWVQHLPTSDLHFLSFFLRIAHIQLITFWPDWIDIYIQPSVNWWILSDEVHGFKLIPTLQGLFWIMCLLPLMLPLLPSLSSALTGLFPQLSILFQPLCVISLSPALCLLAFLHGLHPLGASFCLLKEKSLLWTFHLIPVDDDVWVSPLSSALKDVCHTQPLPLLFLVWVLFIFHLARHIIPSTVTMFHTFCWRFERSVFSMQDCHRLCFVWTQVAHQKAHMYFCSLMQMDKREFWKWVVNLRADWGPCKCLSRSTLLALSQVFLHLLLCLPFTMLQPFWLSQ